MIGDLVYSLNFGTGQKWLPEVIQQVTGPVSFMVRLEDGKIMQRHQDQIGNFTGVYLGRGGGGGRRRHSPSFYQTRHPLKLPN